VRVFLTFLGIGLLAGVLSGVFGIGGGIIIVPSLVFFAKMAQKTAVGTSLGALLLPVGLLGVWTYYKNGHINVAASLWIALGMFFGAYGGSVLAQSVSDNALKRGFAVLLVVVATRLWWSTTA
jgi:uncharacterized membrane protein YfcA